MSERNAFDEYAQYWMMDLETTIVYPMTETKMSTGDEVMQLTVNEAIRRYPATVEIFNRYGIDACCGGAAPVLEAAVRDGADPDALANELKQAIGQAA